MEKEKFDNFLKKCKNDLKVIRERLKKYLEVDNIQNIELYTYKYCMCTEIYDLFKSKKGGVNSFIEEYGDEENPLMKIFEDYITEFTEPTLMTENKLYKLLDKKEV